MKTYIHLSGRHHYTLPAIFQDDDVRYAESLVEHFLEQYTQKGDVVLNVINLLVKDDTTLFPLAVSEAPVIEAQADITRLCQMLGYSRAELLQASWPSLTHPDDIEKNIEVFFFTSPLRTLSTSLNSYRWAKSPGDSMPT